MRFGLHRGAGSSLRIAIAFFAVVGGAPAQSHGIAGAPPIRNYMVRDYGGSAQIWSIVRDRRGLLYTAEEAAIYQYDGVVWRRIPVPSNTVRFLVLDGNGKIWAGAQGDFGFLEPDSAGAMQYVSLLDKVPPEHRGFTDVWRIAATPAGTFFHAREKLFRWDGRRMQVWASPNEFEHLRRFAGASIPTSPALAWRRS